jgi:three-Cys-motif partner protein
MPGKDLHKEPFDDGTLLKLEIFKKYLEEWLPVFLNWKFDPIELNIVDFFAGQGKDINGVSGSPLLIVETLIANTQKIKSKNLKIRVILNELDKEKFAMLSAVMEPYRDSGFELILENEAFSDCFNKHLTKFTNAANYIFLDQNGIKEITEGIFAQLISLKKTDILFFISSSYLFRFKALEEFAKYLNINKIAFDESNYHSCHRAVVKFYRSQIAKNKEYYLGPFSLKKGSNIYGLIFGSNHSYGIEKFLKICWGLDPQRGEANYDIDSDKINPSAPSLFAQYNIPKKVQEFEVEIAKYLQTKEHLSLYNIYRLGLFKGFQPRHINKVLNNLKAKKHIDFSFSLIREKVHKTDQTLKVTNLLWRNQE